MKNKRQFTVILIAVVLLVAVAATILLASKRHRSGDSVLPVSAGSSSDAPYTDAVNHILENGSYSMEVSSLRETALSDQVLRESSTRMITCKDYGTQDMQVDVQENAVSGPHAYTISERYTGGNTYITLDDSHFSSHISAENYLDRLPPVALLTPSLYKNIEAQPQGSLTLIGFSEPSAIEPWAAGEKAALKDGSGSALIDSNGNLLQASYTVTYSLGEVEISRVYKVQYAPAQMDAFTPIVVPGPYVELPSIDIPRLLEKSTGYLLQAQKIRAEKEEKIYCQAGNLTRTQNTALDVNGLGENLNVNLSTDVELIDYNQGGTATRYSQTETFQDGNYSLSVTEGNNPQEKSAEITNAVMEKYCHDLLVGSIVLPQFIESISMDADENNYTITFIGSEALSEAICADACKVLYQDPNMLSSISTSYETNKMETTLLLDITTMLPVGSGFSYQGTHTINDTSYTLSSELTQRYQFQ